MTDQTSTTEPRSSWNKRLISPKFNDELYLWMSTIPVICGLFQFLMTFGYYLGFLGLVFVGGGKGGGSSKSGVGALILVMFSLILTVGLFIAFITGFFYGLNTLKLAYDVARPLLFIWLAIVILGSLFKNTIKVKAVGDNELQYGLRSLYFWAMALTALLTFMVAEHVISNELVETGGGNTVLIPFAFFACFLSLFHGIIKPATTSLIILFIQFFVTPSEEIKTLISQRRQENKEGREIVSSELKKILDFIRYTIILAVIVFLISIRAMDALDLGQQVLGPSLAPYTFDMFLHMFGHAEMLIWFSLIAWFSLSSIMSPQRSLIAKIMRKQGKDPIQSKNIIVTAGAISFALLIGGISADVKLFPGMDKNNSESIILQTTQASTPYYSYSTTKQIFRSQPELFEYLNTSPPPAQDYGWLYDLAKKKPKGPKRNKIFQTIKNLKQKHIAEHYEKANEKALSTKYKTLKQLLFIIVSATSAAVFLGALTTISTQLLMYAASAISVCFIFSLTVTGDLSMLARGVTYIIEYFQWFYQHNFQTSNFNS